jgi:hypothetical protein
MMNLDFGEFAILDTSWASNFGLRDRIRPHQFASECIQPKDYNTQMTQFNSPEAEKGHITPPKFENRNYA